MGLEGNEVRSAFVNEVLEEVEEMDIKMFPIPKEPEDGEVVKGELSLYCKKLYTLVALYARECDRMQVELKYASEEEKGRVEYALFKAQAKNNLAGEMMYSSIREDFKIFGSKHVGVRKGYLAVETTCGPDCGHSPNIRMMKLPKGLLDMLGGLGEE